MFFFSILAFACVISTTTNWRRIMPGKRRKKQKRRKGSEKARRVVQWDSMVPQKPLLV